MSTAEQKNIKIIYGLKSFEIVNFEINLPKTKPKKVGYSINIDINYDQKNKNVLIIVEASVKRSKQAKKSFCTVVTKSVFEIRNHEDLEDMPQEFSKDLILAAYSTTRGVLIAKNEDNFISESPLPILNLHSMRGLREKKKKVEG